MNQYRMFYLQTSTLPPRMHHKLTKHERFCKQNNQLPTKSNVELKDNSNIHTFNTGLQNNALRIDSVSIKHQLSGRDFEM